MKTSSDLILEYLENKGEVKKKRIINDIKILSSISFVALSKALKILLDKKYIIQTHYGYYQISPEYRVLIERETRLKEYFCFVDEHFFTSDENIEDVACPICGQETIKEIKENQIKNE